VYPERPAGVGPGRPNGIVFIVVVVIIIVSSMHCCVGDTHDNRFDLSSSGAGTDRTLGED
jgi:hypothetical protein